MIRNVFKAALVAVAALAAGSGTARADFINGGFESGNFNGFQVIGDADVLTGAAFPVGAGVPPPGGTFAARITTGAIAPVTTGSAAPVSAAALATFLGVTEAQIEAALGIDATEGSGIRQTVTVNAGDVLTFQFNFITNEATPGVNDTAFVTIVPSVGSPVVELADTNSAGFVLAPGTLPAEPPFSSPTEMTGFRTFSFTFTTGGVFTIGVGVVDAGDTLVTSALVVDNFQIVAAVPEPASLTLLGLGAAGVVGYRRRKAAKVA